MNSTDESIKGVWKNEYDSIMTIDEVSQGTFKGEYSSTTGDTGTYKVVGVYDTAPANLEQTVAFAISWRSLDVGDDGEQGSVAHYSSAFSGQIQHNGSSLIMPVIHILSSPNKPGNAWENSLVDKLTFVKQEE
ncbi:MAG: hypothetical protein KAI25_07420 [Hyphomicrobiaceae bacterium]|nr:hypothetical protein [Hyphomicrobiaceae bacterium]